MPEGSNVTSAGTETQPSTTTTTPTQPPLPNSPEARTADGTLKDAGASPTSTQSTESRTDGTTPTTTPEPKPGDTPKPVVPETYTFKAPDGREFDKPTIDRATPIFKELGLDQAGAQKLVDIWNEQTERQLKAVNDMRADWRESINKDKDMSGKLEQIKVDIGRMKDSIFANNADARSAFEDAMNLTGAGDHPAIVKAWWKASEAFREGQHVSGGGPSGHGQTQSGTVERPSAAAAMYPNLPHA
jgi:hypothetical protein